MYVQPWYLNMLLLCGLLMGLKLLKYWKGAARWVAKDHRWSSMYVDLLQNYLGQFYLIKAVSYLLSNLQKSVMVLTVLVVENTFLTKVSRQHDTYVFIPHSRVNAFRYIILH